jgi:hypothetical protein
MFPIGLAAYCAAGESATMHYVATGDCYLHVLEGIVMMGEPGTLRLPAWLRRLNRRLELWSMRRPFGRAATFALQSLDLANERGEPVDLDLTGTAAPWRLAIRAGERLSVTVRCIDPLERQRWPRQQRFGCQVLLKMSRVA